MQVKSFEELEIWKEARLLSNYIYKITKEEPFSRDYKLRDQIRTSSGSVMDNIAEGFERSGNKEFIQFLSVSKGSCGECRSQSYRAFDYNYIGEDVLADLVSRTTHLSKMIASLLSYLKNSQLKGSKYS